MTSTIFVMMTWKISRQAREASSAARARLVPKVTVRKRRTRNHGLMRFQHFLYDCHELWGQARLVPGLAWKCVLEYDWLDQSLDINLLFVQRFHCPASLRTQLQCMSSLS